MQEETVKCPVCEGSMRRVDVPQFDIYTCLECKELGQLADGTVRPLNSLLEGVKLGEDRVMNAISQPHVTTAKSFIDIFENATRSMQMDLAVASGGFRTVLHMVENRIDSALQCFTGLDMASDEAAQGLTALREARELVSTRPRQTRGVKSDDSVDSATSPSE